MSSELGQGRPQDWPHEMYAFASKIRERTDEAREQGQPVVLTRPEAMDVSVGMNVGGDAISRDLARRRGEDPEPVAWLVEFAIEEDQDELERMIFDGENARAAARKSVEAKLRTGYAAAWARPLFAGPSLNGFDHRAVGAETVG